MRLSREVKTFLAIAMAHFLVDCFGGIWPLFKYLAGLDLVKAGIIASITTMVGSLIQPLFGIYADRGHRRGLVIWGSLLTFPGVMLGLVALHMADLGDAAGYGLLFVVMLLVRVGQGMFHPAGAGLAGNLMPTRRSAAVAAFIAAGGFGFALSEWLFGFTWQLAGQHTEWLLLPGAGMLWLIVAWCRPRGQPADRRVTLGESVAGVVAMGRPVLLLFAMLALMASLNYALIFLMPEFLDLRGYPTWMIRGGGHLLLIAGSVLVMVPAGFLADRFGRRRMLLVTLGLSLVTYYALVASPSLSLAAFVPLMLLTGACIGTANPLGVAFGQHLAPANSSMVSAVLMGLAWAVGSVGQTVAGALAERPSLGPVGALMWAGVTIAAALLLTLLLPTGRDAQPAAA
ncbi:MAG: hypothetical protein BIFFINMI_00740 [Phycisphaerae bacterium]|nr:hypothetical protein [Phycisphaerae bacterium]